jgi:hypothetical protein
MLWALGEHRSRPATRTFWENDAYGQSESSQNKESEGSRKYPMYLNGFNKEKIKILLLTASRCRRYEQPGFDWQIWELIDSGLVVVLDRYPRWTHILKLVSRTHLSRFTFLIHNLKQLFRVACHDRDYFNVHQEEERKCLSTAESFPSTL